MAKKLLRVWVGIRLGTGAAENIVTFLVFSELRLKGSTYL